jgi:hypothetical protein
MIGKHKTFLLRTVLHGREIRCFALPEEHTVRVVTGRSIFGPSRNEAILGRRKYEYTRSNKCHNLYYSPDKLLRVLGVQNQKEMVWTNKSTGATTNAQTQVANQKTRDRTIDPGIYLGHYQNGCYRYKGGKMWTKLVWLGTGSSSRLL